MNMAESFMSHGELPPDTQAALIDKITRGFTPAENAHVPQPGEGHPQETDQIEQVGITALDQTGENSNPELQAWLQQRAVQLQSHVEHRKSLHPKRLATVGTAAYWESFEHRQPGFATAAKLILEEVKDRGADALADNPGLYWTARTTLACHPIYADWSCNVGASSESIAEAHEELRSALEDLLVVKNPNSATQAQLRRLVYIAMTSYAQDESFVVVPGRHEQSIAPGLNDAMIRAYISTPSHEGTPVIFPVHFPSQLRKIKSEQIPVAPHNTIWHASRTAQHPLSRHITDLRPASHRIDTLLRLTATTLTKKPEQRSPVENKFLRLCAREAIRHERAIANDYGFLGPEPDAQESQEQ